MVVPWTDPRCIVCLEERELTVEHIIPALVGGRLRSSFLCKPCNSTLGTTIDSRVKSDPHVRRAALQLKETLPELVETIEDGAAYVGKSGYGEFQGSVKAGAFRPHPLRPGDGSLMLATPEARDAIVQMLRKQGRDLEIPAALEKFDGAPANERIELAPGIEIIEWHTEGIRPALETGLGAPDTWALKTAYEFLACCIGSAIYSDALEPYRRMLRGGNWEDTAAAVERLQAGAVTPIHGLVLEDNAPHTRVQVRLFRQICFRVHFKRIALSGPRWIYQQHLAEPNELFAILEPSDSAGGTMTAPN